MAPRLTRTLATLTGQGWQITGHSYGRVVLSMPYPKRSVLRSWDMGVIATSVILLCVAARVPLAGAVLLSAVSVAGMVWAVISMVLWRRPVWVLTLSRDSRGDWHEHGPVLRKG